VLCRLAKENEALRTRNIYLEARDLGLNESVSKRESREFASKTLGQSLDTNRHADGMDGDVDMNGTAVDWSFVAEGMIQTIYNM
jgi:hypothetical protein